MKLSKPVKFILIAIVGLPVLIGVFAVILALSDIAGGEKKDKEAPIARRETQRLTDSIKAVRLQEGLALADSMMGKFHQVHDEFEDYSYLVHKNWREQGEAYHTTPIVLIGEDGTMVLRTFHTAHTWLFHESAIFIIDGQKYETPLVPTSDPMNSRDMVKASRIKEVVTYGKAVDHYPALIAMAKEPVKVRLVGKRENFDFVIREQDQQAFRESYEMSKALKMVSHKFQ